MTDTDAQEKSSARQYFLGGATGLFALKLVGVGLGLAVTTILARSLGAAEFGIFSFAIGMATLLALPFSGGLPTLLVAEISAARSTGQTDVLVGVTRWGYMMQAGLALAVAVIAAVFWFGAHAFDIWPFSPTESTLVLLVICLVPAMGLISMQRGLMNGYERPVLATLSEQVFRPLAMLALLWFAFSRLGYSSASALSLQLVATIIAGLIAAVVVLRVVPKLQSGRPVYRWKEWSLAMLPLTATAATTIVNNNTDIIMLGFLQPPEEAGIYRIAAQLAVVAALAMQIMRSLAAPKIASAHAKGNSEMMRWLLVQTGRAMTGAAVIFVILFAIFGEYALVLVFGAEYAGSYWPCLILALGTAFSACCGLVGVSLQMTRNAGIVARSAIWAAIANVVLNLALVPTYGAIGAAIGTSVSLVAMQVQLFWKAQKALGIRTDIFQRVKAA